MNYCFLTICWLTYLALSIFGTPAVNCEKLKVQYEWKQLEFAWPSQRVRDKVIASGHYVPANNLPNGFDVWKNKLFITVPRWKTGVASTLNYIDLDADLANPTLKPYPNWRANFLPFNATIISTFHVRVDECDRLWVLDTGKADNLGDTHQILPPSILIFDLNTDSLVDRISLPDNVVHTDSMFAKIIVDTDHSKCHDAFAYIPDTSSSGLVVLSLKARKFWFIRHQYFHTEPLAGEFLVGGLHFQWDSAIFGLTLSKQLEDGSRNVYFHSLAGTHEFVVSNKVLQNETFALNKKESFHKYYSTGDRGMKTQVVSEAFDTETGVIFFGLVNKNAIGCWNTKNPLNPSSFEIVDSNPDTLVWPNELKIDHKGNIWVLSNQLPLFLKDKLKDDNINYRILQGNAKSLIVQTSCDISF